MAAAPGVDVHTAPPRVTRLHAQLGRLAARHDVHVNALYTMLVKFIVIAKTHDVLQQTCLVDLRAAVADADTAPVGLAGHQAIAFEQMADESFGHWLLVLGGT